MPDYEYTAEMKQRGRLLEATQNEDAEVYVHSGMDPDPVPVFFEVPQELTDRVYALDSKATFVELLEKMLELAETSLWCRSA